MENIGKVLKKHQMDGKFALGYLELTVMKNYSTSDFQSYVPIRTVF